MQVSQYVNLLRDYELIAFTYILKPLNFALNVNFVVVSYWLFNWIFYIVQAPYPEVKAEPIEDVNIVQGEDEVTCPCREIKNDDWVGCDMHEKCAHEWFHLGCVNLAQLPPDDATWFWDGCKKKYKKEIEAKLKELNEK